RPARSCAGWCGSPTGRATTVASARAAQPPPRRAGPGGSLVDRLRARERGLPELVEVEVGEAHAARRAGVVLAEHLGQRGEPVVVGLHGVVAPVAEDDQDRKSVV